MSRVTVTAWKCDKVDCGHIWLADQKPTRCARCKSRTWDNDQLDDQPAPAPKKPASTPPKAAKPAIKADHCEHRFASICDDCAKALKHKK